MQYLGRERGRPGRIGLGPAMTQEDKERRLRRRSFIEAGEDAHAPDEHLALATGRPESQGIALIIPKSNYCCSQMQVSKRTGEMPGTCSQGAPAFFCFQRRGFEVEFDPIC